MAPLALPLFFNPATGAALAAAAEYVLAAAVGILLGVGVYEGGKVLSEQISKADADAKAETKDVVADTTCENCDRCRELIAEINEKTAELKRRRDQMRIDDKDLFTTRPAGKFSWQGHIDQFQNKQTNLRALIAEAQTLGCQIPPDA
jgi:uncharacterized protein HemX